MEQNPSSEPVRSEAPLAPAPYGSEPVPPMPTSGAPTASPTSASTASIFQAKDVELHKYLAALSYLGILVFVPLLLKRESAFCRMHSAQGILLLAAWMVLIFFVWIPVVGWLLGIGLFLAHIGAFISCLQGSFWEVPFIGAYRKKLQLDEK